MSTLESQDLKSHWAIQAIGAEPLERANILIHETLIEQAVGQQILFNFDHNNDDYSLLDRVALAYELAAIEGIETLTGTIADKDPLRRRTVLASSHAFDIRRLLPIPEAPLDRLFSVLQLSSLAYCGDRWSDLRRWYRNNKLALKPPSVASVSWDQRLLYRLFHCWIRLFRKEGWDDLDRIRETIAGLRNDQIIMEKEQLKSGSHTTDQVMALRLIALYHWAKATEIIAHYMLQGEPHEPMGQIDKHFEAAIEAATASGDPQHEIILRWLHASGKVMILNSLWWTARSVNSRISEFVGSLTKRDSQAMFELLPPQRSALLEQGLLDLAKTAIVIDLPTSGGKTLLAQFRILQALNQFKDDNGWIAYVAPTRALSAQLTRRLRRDFDPIGIKVEQLTSAIDLDVFEEELLSGQKFDILISTPEKLSLVIRNKKISRPLALVVMDEAHNIENDSRGMRIEFLLATIKRDCQEANFLLLMPHVEDPEPIARWLAHDSRAGQSISLGTTPWKPNERIIGIYRAVPDDNKRAGWRIEYHTLTTTKKTIHLKGTHKVGDTRPLDVPRSKVIGGQGEQKGLGLQTAAMGSIMSARGTSISVANNIKVVWNMAEEAAKSLPYLEELPNDVRLVQDFLRTEFGPDFLLIYTLDHGIGVHHAGLSDEVRALMEWLTETGSLRMLCATSTIAQGIDFPVSSVFLSTLSVSSARPPARKMSYRDFWNLAGRAGRIGHDSVGVIGIAEGNDADSLVNFVSQSTGALISRLVTLIDQLASQGRLEQLSDVLWEDQWEDFRCYIAHLWAEKKDLDAVLAESEQLLRQTYGYTTLRNDPDSRPKARALLEAAQSYAHRLADMRPGIAEIADSTGFSPEGVRHAILGMRNLENRLTPNDWAPKSLFGEGGKMAELFGVMLKIPQLRGQLEEIGGQGFDHSRISNIVRDWVNGKGIDFIAKKYFVRDGKDNITTAMTTACRAIYRSIVNSGTWGISALTHISGLDFETLSEAERRQINTLPAMIYHGVQSADAILMRMNSVPRSVAESLGDIYRDIAGDNEERFSVSNARDFLRDLSHDDWDRARPIDAALSGTGYKEIWEVLSGETV